MDLVLRRRMIREDTDGVKERRNIVLIDEDIEVVLRHLSEIVRDDIDAGAMPTRVMRIVAKDIPGGRDAVMDMRGDGIGHTPVHTAGHRDLIRSLVMIRTGFHLIAHYHPNQEEAISIKMTTVRTVTVPAITIPLADPRDLKNRPLSQNPRNTIQILLKTLSDHFHAETKKTEAANPFDLVDEAPTDLIKATSIPTSLQTTIPPLTST